MTKGTFGLKSLMLNEKLVFTEASPGEHHDALSFVKRAHYQDGMPRGQIIIARFQDPSLAAKLRKRVSTVTDIDPEIVGVAVIGSGCVRGKPRGRVSLAAKHFPSLVLETTSRDTTVAKMGLAMINRIAVDAAFRGLGIA